MVDEQQMSFFEEGGMSAPEVEADPVSGNEVPPGSLPEEVRDDVDAKLSTGEYVVPADVLRYYGMKFFEDLREQAKESLAEMDSEGRIGGEPMTDQEGTPEGLSEQEMALLQEIMSEGGEEPQFNQGGMVLQNPEFYPKVGMAEGGMTSRPTFNPEQWRDVGSSLSSNQSGTQGIGVGSYYKTYVGPNGETRLILFVNGEPATPIPEGFTEQKTAADKVQEEIAKEEDLSTGNDSESDQRRQEAQEDADEAQSWAEKNYEAVNGDPIAFGLEQLQGGFADRLGGQAGRIGGVLMGPAGMIGGGLVGAAMQLDNVANARAAQLQAKAAGIDTTELDNQIEEYTSNLSGVAKMLDDAGFATGQKKFESLSNLSGETKPSQTESAFPTFSSTRPSGSDGKSKGPSTSYSGGEDSNEGSRAPSSSSRPESRPSGSNAGARGVGQETAAGNKAGAMTAARDAGVSAGTAAGLSGQQSSNPGGFDREEGDWATGPMNKGGLVKRRKKKTTKT